MEKKSITLSLCAAVAIAIVAVGIKKHEEEKKMTGNLLTQNVEALSFDEYEETKYKSVTETEIGLGEELHYEKKDATTLLLCRVSKSNVVTSCKAPGGALKCPTIRIRPKEEHTLLGVEIEIEN